ncbi:hypothetical protein [Macrococcus equipercicus]|uniref:NERD domain-containing protein n=1 Tax=Macrococcus equipercicus TaxID=69967 RepID=A0A9Q9BU80_9STAP|nr:hypothetical protein [Macrococcus equipercicus]UTH14544.1 hypothetical protein KFV11_04060 [Macrococcus equipercicus]
MIIKARRNYKQVELLEALKHRTDLTSHQLELLRHLKETTLLEQHFELYLSALDMDNIDVIWQFNYSDYHQDALINLVLISNDGIYLFKLNNYSGLHYINHHGMLADYFTDEVKIDLVHLNCVKYSIYNILDPRLKQLPIIIKCVCLNDRFALDGHASKQHFLFKNDIAAYLSQIKGSHKKKRELLLR